MDTRASSSLPAWLPCWLTGYRRAQLPGDLAAGLIVTVMLIPQSLAYAMLAGLPPETGLYASILPILAYALFGTSMTLAVGPVAVISLMTASALQPLAAPGSPEYGALAVQLALLSGLLLVAFGLLRLGFLASFISQPVVSGFISGSAILIALGQAKHLFGVRAGGESAFDAAIQLAISLQELNPATAAIGLGTVAFLFAARGYLPGLLERTMKRAQAELLARLAPMFAIVATTALAAVMELEATAGVSVVGAVPAGFPSIGMSLPGSETLANLWLPALLISLVGFVESVSVARSLGLKRRQRVRPDRELLGLGAANLASAVSGGFPVTGGFARSVVNFAAGANTPMAGVFSALLMAGVIAGLTGLFHSLPQAALAATIIVAVSSLFDWAAIREAWRYDRGDAAALLMTLAAVVALGVEQGIVTGVAASLALLVWRSSRPHIAVVGRVPGTEHFRNVERHEVETRPDLVALRVDESLFFGNAAAVEDRIERSIAGRSGIHRVLLICSAVNHVDSTALGMLDELERNLAGRGVELVLAEVKGPVMDRLRDTEFGARMLKRIYLRAHEAFG